MVNIYIQNSQNFAPFSMVVRRSQHKYSVGSQIPLGTACPLIQLCYIAPQFLSNRWPPIDDLKTVSDQSAPNLSLLIIQLSTETTRYVTFHTVNDIAQTLNE
jgi:hypothetical protein